MTPTATTPEPSSLPLDLLACPACRGALRADDAPRALRCAACDAEYPSSGPHVELLPPALRPRVDGPRAGDTAIDPGDASWARWREAIRGLEAWRARRAARADARGALPSDGASDAAVRALFDRAQLRPGAAVLDVGARDGARRALLPEGVRYVGVDPFPARSDAGALVVRGVAEALPVRDAGVDAVVSLAAFDYFADGQLALREMARALKPGGALALLVSVVSATVANARGAPSRTARLASAMRAAVSEVGLGAGAGLVGAALLERDRPHTHYYTRAQLTAMVRVRFDIDEIDEAPQAASTILYINARKRRLGRLPVVR